MMNLVAILFYSSSLLLLYIWILFPLAIFVLAKLRQKPAAISLGDHQPRVSILIACLNEEASIALRITNIFESHYPDSKIEVIVISDGSSDNTVKNARACSTPEKHIRVIENKERSGRAIAHNIGVLEATGDILIFTDAGTSFDIKFISTITKPFLNPSVGFATGCLIYTNSKSTAITESAGIYWRFEQALRIWESQCNLNVIGSGACCAMRKNLFRDIPETGDVDFTSPLDVALQNYQCIHVPEALAYDEMPASQESEVKARIRMTSKNFKGMLERWGWSGIWKHPSLTWVILSHKYGRWITPFLLVIILASSIAVWFQNSGLFINLVISFQIVFYTLGILGFLKVPVPLGSTIYSFLLGNFGMMMGVIKVIRGNVQASYVPIRNESDGQTKL